MPRLTLRKGRPPTFNSWRKMHERCGGLGYEHVTVCPRWHDYTAFVEDMGIRPHGMTLDRIDNSKGYVPGNCRWATPETQSNNTSVAKHYTINGVRLSISQWARRSGVPRETLRDRLHRGVSPAKAILTPGVALPKTVRVPPPKPCPVLKYHTVEPAPLGAHGLLWSMDGDHVYVRGAGDGVEGLPRTRFSADSFPLCIYGTYRVSGVNTFEELKESIR